MSSERISRRRFLKTAAVGAAGLATGLPSLAGKKFAANDRIQMGVIGCGGMGTGHLHHLVDMSKDPANGVAVVGVCDVYEARKKRAQDITGAKVHHEFEEMLARKDVDAVLIATPDHWHSRITIAAMQAGKDVYCEKPMTRTWQEAKQVWEATHKLNRVLQVGAQSASEDRWWRAHDWIKTGQIGKVLWTKSSYSRNSREGEWNWGIDPDAGPKNIDWKRWLGNAPKRKWDPDRFFRFRKYWDYSGGIATDLFYHQLAHLEVALGPEFPMYVMASGGIYEMKDREVPDTFHMMIDYPSLHTVVLCSSMANRLGFEDTIAGHEGTLYFDTDGFRYVPEDEFKDKHQAMEVKPRPRQGHMENFLACVRDRSTPHCGVDTAFRVMVAIALGVESYRKRRVMRFDEKELKAF